MLRGITVLFLALFLTTGRILAGSEIPVVDMKILSYDQIEARSVENVAMRRMVTEEDIAGTVLFLCSTAGSSVSAQSVSVCGGLEVI